MITKEQMIEALSSMPDDATVEEAMDRLYILARIDRGLAQIHAGKGIPHDEVRQRLLEWRE